MRSFIAIEFDKETKLFLENVQQTLRNSGVTGNYSHTENLHITIKFLGEIDPPTFQKVCDLLKKVSQNQQSFVLTLDSFGKFDKGNKMILWYGLKRSDALTNLHQMVENELDHIIPGLREKRYSPHITLVREATCKNGLPDVKAAQEQPTQSFTVKGLSLMESTRIEGKLTYIRRAFEPFKT